MALYSRRAALKLTLAGTIGTALAACSKSTPSPSDSEGEAPAKGAIHSYSFEQKVEVGGRQGIAYENKTLYVSDNNKLIVYDDSWSKIAENDNPLGSIDPSAQDNHIGDIDVYDRVLYLVAEDFNGKDGSSIQICAFDTTDLSLSRKFTFDKDSGEHEASSITVIPENNSVMVSSWVSDASSNYLYEYDIATGNFIRELKLLDAPSRIQGVSYYKGALFFSCDDSDKTADHIYSAPLPDANAEEVHVSLELTLNPPNIIGECEGLAFDTDMGRMLVSLNDGSDNVLIYTIDN